MKSWEHLDQRRPDVLLRQLRDPTARVLHERYDGRQEQVHLPLVRVPEERWEPGADVCDLGWGQERVEPVRPVLRKQQQRFSSFFFPSSLA